MLKSSSNGEPTKGNTVAVLSLGANVGSREEAILHAVDRLTEEHGITVGKLSSLYETEPVDIRTEHAFINAVCVIETALEPGALLAACKRLEREFGRNGCGRGGDRTLDIDIVLYGDRLVMEPGLVIPHPRFRERPFVLIPLHEVIPDLRIPPDHSSVHEVAEKTSRSGWVRKVSSRNEIS